MSSTAPRAKLGTMTSPAPDVAAFAERSVDLGVVEAGGADHGRHAGLEQHGGVLVHGAGDAELQRGRRRGERQGRADVLEPGHLSPVALSGSTSATRRRSSCAAMVAALSEPILPAAPVTRTSIMSPSSGVHSGTARHAAIVPPGEVLGDGRNGSGWGPMQAVDHVSGS